MGNCCAPLGESHLRQSAFWLGILLLAYAQAEHCGLEYRCLLKILATWIIAFTIIIGALRARIQENYGHLRFGNFGAYYSKVELSPPTREASPLAGRASGYSREPFARYKAPHGSGGAASACITADESILSDNPLETFAIEASSLLAPSIESGHLERTSFRGTSIESNPMEGTSSSVNVQAMDGGSHPATSDPESGAMEGTSSSINAMESAPMGVSSISRTTNDSVPMEGSSSSDAPMESLHTDPTSPKPGENLPCWSGI